MPSLKRLKARYQDLEEEWEEVSKKLRFFKKEIIIKTDAEAKYELEQRIEEYEAKQKEIEEELDELEEQINQPEQSQKADLEKSQSLDLYKPLLKLGYWEQHNLFEEIAGKYSYGMFLIQGCCKNYGQKWLLKRLALIFPKILEDKKIIIDLNRTSARTDILAIWNEFAGRVHLPENSLYSQIAEKICELWKSQNVLIVFDNVDQTIKENLCDLLRDFWESLAQQISENDIQQNSYKLIVFLIDRQGVVSGWNVGFVEQYDSAWQPKYPFGLPAINPFLEKDMRDWLNYQSEFLPKTISTNKTETIKAILEKQGIPIPTLQKICDLCGCNWYDQEEKWLRL
ncbi:MULTISPECIES: hypothetical protein [Nostoc]|uniref:Inactive STAND domain-containing protein n=1 Tax=Nostoc paludosum FACHB-159 TaxID=2692908 RepID=A0ABR8K587_9NOSO|nr:MULTISPECIES: hypothetical protein [Nostoc]MBD2677503.1 hypothetical protein [Nostoc sp. FACHB-857]MBD2734103.1 hypothetical protein [Nostoc paludosum FACHB-159]